MDFKNKYLKYKTKYLNAKYAQSGAAVVGNQVVPILQTEPTLNELLGIFNELLGIFNEQMLIIILYKFWSVCPSDCASWRMFERILICKEKIFTGCFIKEDGTGKSESYWLKQSCGDEIALHYVHTNFYQSNSVIYEIEYYSCWCKFLNMILSGAVELMESKEEYKPTDSDIRKMNQTIAENLHMPYDDSYKFKFFEEVSDAEDYGNYHTCVKKPIPNDIITYIGNIILPGCKYVEKKS